MLTLKHLPINSFNENLAYVHKDCTAYKVDDIRSLTKVEIHGGVKTVFCLSAGRRRCPSLQARRTGVEYRSL